MGALEGKVAIVTGAGQGVGRCHAELLATEGASVVVNDFADTAAGVAQAITAAGGTAIAHRSDIADWAATGGLVNAAIDAFGDVDIVVNNAGFVRDAMSFSMTEEQFDTVVGVHLKGHVTTAHWAAQHWRAAAKALSDGELPKQRRIINTSSESGLFGGPAQMNYGSAKAGIVGLTRILAKELGKYGVTVNCIAPRARTKMNENIAMFAPHEGDGFDPYDPAHVSPMVAWLASDAAHDVNGKTFIVTGDEIHVMSEPQVAGTIMAGDERWTVEAISARREELFAQDGPAISPWGGPAMR